MSMLSETTSRTRRAVFLVVGLLAVGAASSACDGCGSKETDGEETGVAEDTQSGDGFDGLDMEKAESKAEKSGEMAAVRRADRARIVSGNLEAETQPSGGGGSGGGGSREPIETGGTIDVTRVKQVFKDHDGQAQKCYERALKQDQNLRGKVILEVTIDTDGSVARVDAQGDTLRNDSVNECLESAARGWEFPKPEGGAKVINKPYNFSPAR